MLPKNLCLKPLSMGTPTMMQSDTVSGPHHKRKGPALLEHPLASGPGLDLLAHRPWSLQARGEAQSRHSQELGPRTQAGPTLGFCLSGCRGSPALPSNTAPLGRGSQMSLARGQGKGGGQLTDGNPTANLPNAHVHTSCVGSHRVSPETSWSEKPAGCVGPCTAGPVAWHAQAAIPAVLTSSCRSQLEALLKQGV